MNGMTNKKDSKSKREKTRFSGTGMDEVHRKHLIKIMKTFKREDYEKIAKDTIEMMGKLTKEDKNLIREIRPKIKK
jgi:hypothetical protein